MSARIISKESPLILASESPRRRELLGQVGIPFRVCPGNIDETSMAGAPSYIAKTLAEKKALSVSADFSGQWILGADTIVVLDDHILGKPADRADASSMLKILSSKDHEVITGFSIINTSGEIVCTDHESTLVSIKSLSDREIDAYIATEEPFGKAGSYAIQGIGAFMVQGIKGDYSNVVGLPLFTLIKRMIEVGALKEFPAMTDFALTTKSLKD
jgi:septum formation protein